MSTKNNPDTNSIITNIFSLNTRGLADPQKRLALFSFLKSKEGSIYFLQECHSSIEEETLWREQWGGEILFSHATRNKKGVAICFKSDLAVDIIDTVTDCNGRFILVFCKIFEIDFVLCNVYAPTKDHPNDQLQFLQEVNDILSDYIHCNVILGGDFNTVLNPSLEKQGGMVANISSYGKQLEQTLEIFDLIDIWRERNPAIKRYTRREKTRAGLIQTRLDFFFISRNLNYIVKMTDIQPSVRSDHSLISITINFSNEQKRGRGVWKLNTDLLKDETYVEIIKKTIDDSIIDSRNILNKSLIWDYIKCRVRDASIEYSIKKSKKFVAQEKNLNERLKILECKITTEPDIHSLDEYFLVKSELEFIYNKKAQGALVRSRCQWAEENEKSTKYFLSLEKRNYKVKHIKSLMFNNQIVTQPNDILNCQKLFYQNLYSKNTNASIESIHNFLNKTGMPEICEKTKAECDNEITETEILNALKQLPNNKTPGLDGIPIEFYKFFWRDIKDIILENFKLSFKNEILSISQRQGLINLIPKKDKDLRNLKNWRPISLLNSDYKIIAKLLSNRIKPALQELINPDQVGYMTERFCGENTRLIADIIEYLKIHNTPGFILLADFEKAFDTVNWDFLFTILDKHNFGPNFQTWIKILYNNITSCISNNGYISDNFPLGQGIRQGCPLSALLFLLIAEKIANIVRANNNVNGFVFDDEHIKLCQLADDMTLFLSDNDSLRHVLNDFEEFYRYAGLKLNRSKTEAIIVYNDGTLFQDDSLGITWTNESFKTLGIWFSIKSEQEMIKLNVDDKMEKMQTLLNIWSSRQLSLKGKITVLKSLIMPHIIHIASVLFLQPNIIKDIDQMFQKFLWSNKKSMIAKNVLHQPINKGGLKMINIDFMIRSIKIMWIKRLNNPCEAKWKHVSWNLLEIQKNQLFTKIGFRNIAKNQIPFYKQVLETWFDFVSVEPTSKKEVLDECLYNNVFLLIDNKPINNAYHDWFRAGILYVKDLFNQFNYLKSKENLEIQYGINIPVMKYNMLVSTIPKKW